MKKRSITFPEIVHTREDVLKYILIWYLDAYSTEEISFLLEKSLKVWFSNDGINDVLDYLIPLNYGI